MDKMIYPPLGSTGLSFEREARGMRSPSIPAKVAPYYAAHLARKERREKARHDQEEARTFRFFLTSVFNYLHDWF